MPQCVADQLCGLFQMEIPWRLLCPVTQPSSGVVTKKASPVQIQNMGSVEQAWDEEEGIHRANITENLQEVQ